MEGASEDVMEGIADKIKGKAKATITKIKEKLKALWEKVKAFFKNTKTYLLAIFQNGAKFAKANQKMLKGLKLDGFEYETYNYTIEGGCKDMVNSIRAVVVSIMGSMDLKKKFEEGGVKTVYENPLTMHYQKMLNDKFGGASDEESLSEYIWGALRGNAKSASDTVTYHGKIDSLVDALIGSQKLSKSFDVLQKTQDDLFKQVADKVEGLYTHWFLGQLGQSWSDACAENLEKHGHILEVPQQTDFYAQKVRPSDNRVFVIVSDAFRYEVAASLAEDLQREMQCKVTLGSCEGLFPTVTKYGMAALLPHKKLEVKPRADGTLAVLADGEPTDAGYRDKLLKKATPASVALKYEDILLLKRQERQALVKGMSVVYIYHDTVDKASHTSDSAVFSACDEAISQIKNLARIIVNDFGGTNIIQNNISSRRN